MTKVACIHAQNDETSCGQVRHAIDACRKDCERIGITLDNASYSRAELRDAEGNVVDAFNTQ